MQDYESTFEVSFERQHRALDWIERLLIRYIESMDRVEADADRDHAVATLKEATTILPRVQQMAKTFRSEWIDFKRRRESDAEALVEGDRGAAEQDLRDACERDAGRFAREFFPDHCRLAPSVFHRWMYREYNRRAGDIPPLREGRRLAVAAPRGHAKSTVQSLILPLHSLLHGRERYIVLLSATLKQSRQRLAALATELKTNEALRRVYGEAEAMGARFAADSFEAFGARVDAYSAGTEFRGVTHREFRPTHVILDDAEDSESVESAEQREKLADWFNEVVENLGNGYTNITVVGTLLHPRSLLADLLRRPDYRSVRFRAVRAFARRQDLWDRWRALYTDLRRADRARNALAFYREHKREMDEGARALWPEKETYYKLMIQMATRGRRAFFQEKQNEPGAGNVALFDPARARRFRIERDALVVEPRPDRDGAAPTGTTAGDRDGDERVGLDELRVVGFLDTAMGRGRSGDFAALVTVGIDRHGLVYALDARVERARPSEQARWLFDAAERWRHDAIGVEANGFQELMLLPIDAERKRRRTDSARRLAIAPVWRRGSKDARIRALEGMIANDTLRFARGLSETFLQQLESYPGRHDDGPDALAGAVEMTRPAGPAPDAEQRRPRVSTRGLRSF